MRTGVIYYLRNLVNGKGYVGQSTEHEHRWQVHIRTASVIGVTTLLHRAIRKYGVENFSAEVVCTCAVEKLNARETFYIKKLSTFVDEPNGGGYNLTLGGDFPRPSKETIERRSASLRLTYALDPTLRHRTGGAHKGKTVSPAVRAKISTAHKGVRLSAQHVEALRGSWLSGTRKSANTEECSRKISAGLKKRYATDDALRQRLSDAHKGSTFSEEHRRKLSELRKRVLASKTPEERSAIALRGVATRRARQATA